MMGTNMGQIIIDNINYICEEKGIPPGPIIRNVNEAKTIDAIQDILEVNFGQELKIIT